MENNLTVEMPEEDLITLMREIRKLHRMGGTATMFYCEIGASVRICLHKNKTTYEKTFILDPERRDYKCMYLKCLKTLKKLQTTIGGRKRTEEMYQECLEYLNKMKETV